MAKTILTGHVSPDTAYVVKDYPYGFKLRCQIRYWLDCNLKHGARLISQTSNPKKPGTVWNKTNASTYARFAGCMYLDETGHVQWEGLTEYTDSTEALAWVAEYGAGCPELLVPTMNKWVRAKTAYDKAKAEGRITITATTATRIV